MTDHAHELRRNARKIAHPAGDVPAVMRAAADEIERLQSMIYAQPAPSAPGTHNGMVVGLDYQGAMSCARQRAKQEAGLLYPEGDARKEEKERELASEYYRQYTTPNPRAPEAKL